MNSTGLLNASHREKTPDCNWIAGASQSLPMAEGFGSLTSNDSDSAQLVRDKISQAAIAVEDLPQEDTSGRARKLLSFNEFAYGVAGAAAIFVIVACLLAH